MDKPTVDSRSEQSFAIIKNTGHGNFLLAVSKLELEVKRLACVESPPPPHTTLLRFFSEGRGQLYIGYLKRVICTDKLSVKIDE